MGGTWRAALALLVWLGFAIFAAGASAGTISGTEGQQFSGQVASVTATCQNPTNPSATINWGDSAGSSSGQTSTSGSQITVSGTSPSYYSEEGSYAGSVSGSYTCPPGAGPAGGPQSFSAGFTAQVADAPLTGHAGGQLASATTGQGQTWRLGLFTDPGSSGSLSDYTVTIDWGDNSQSSGTVAPCTGSTFCVSTFYVNGTHTYDKPGGYTITARVSDEGGATTTLTDTVKVFGQPVYCPSNPPSYWGDAGSANYSLSPAQAGLDSNGNPTGQYVQTLTLSPGYEITTNQCWIYAGVPQGGGKHALVDFATFGWVDLNGVYLYPQGDSELVVGSDGTVKAYPVVPLKPLRARRAHRAGDPVSATTYQIQVPTHDLPGEGPPLVVIGQQDLGGAGWTYDPGSNLIGGFGPSPQGPKMGSQGITSGKVWLGFGGQLGTPGNAHVEAYLPVPAFSTQPDGGPHHNAGPPTTTIAYDAYNEFAPTSGSGSAGGGVGQQPPPTPCQQELIKINCGGVVFQSRDRGVASRAGPAPGWHATSDPSGSSPDSEWFLGGMGFGDASLAYDPATDLWTGQGSIPFFNATLSGGFSIYGNGSFDSGQASLACSSQPCTGVPLFPGVDLTSVNAFIKSHPYRFGGGLGISVAGGLLTINGCALAIFADPYNPYSYSQSDFPCGPSALHTSGSINSFAAGIGATAKLNVLGGIPLGGGYVFYISEGSAAYFEFAGHLGPIDVGPVSAGADLAGQFDTGNGQYNASGDLYATIQDLPFFGSASLSLAADVSNVGIAACIGGKKSDGTGCSALCAGFTYQWSQGFPSGFTFLGSLTGTCDFGPIVVAVQRSGAGDPGHAAQASGPVSFNLPKGVPSADVYVDSAGAPPLVTVTGPHGQQLSNPTPGQPAKSPDIVLWPIPALHQTMVILAHPPAGRWTITPLPNSDPITRVAYAKGLAPPSIHTRVSDPSGRFSLHYAIRPRAGQSVEFIERGRGVYHVLGHASHRSGVLRFSPGLGPGGPRQIEAVISLNGLPSRTLVVGRYEAPPPPRPTRPGHLRIRPTARALIITWGATRNTRIYLVTARLSDGRNLAYEVRAGTHRLTIPMVERGTGARVMILGFGPANTPGPAATARLAPAQPPARVTGIRVRRSGNRLTITWRRTPRAVHYLLQITISGPTSARLYAMTDKPTLSPKNASLMLQGGSVSRISIAGVSLQSHQGPAGTLRYAPGRGRARTRRTRGRVLDLFE